MSLRIFCPLSKKWFRLIKWHLKSWEFRDIESPVARQILRQQPHLPLDIEFREGYRGESVWGRIDKFIEFSNPSQVPKRLLNEGRVSLSDLKSVADSGRLLAIHFKLTSSYARHRGTSRE